ncbi:MAG: hypothetical protein NT031_09125, partial [Planctomycetota bacterium]|nr:hypothetical protein [Planctomycetota bacterium]
IRSALAAEAPHAPVMTMSALKGNGVETWLDRVLAGGPAGANIVDVDYDTYAAGEAALGWLNASIDLAAAPTDWKPFASSFMHTAQEKLRAASAEIAHLKILVISDGGRLQMNLTSSQGTPATLGGLLRPTPRAKLIVNARVRTAPEDLQAVVESSLRAAAGGDVKATIEELSSFRPGRPQPIHRFSRADAV